MKVIQIGENTSWRDRGKGNEAEARRETSGKELIKTNLHWKIDLQAAAVVSSRPHTEIFVEVVEIEDIHRQNCMVGRPQKQTTSPRRRKAVKP
jgi:hypothetical protein